MKLYLFVLLALVLGVTAQFSARDMLKLPKIGDYAFSPEVQLVYSVSQWDETTDKTTSALYGPQHTPITEPGKNRDSSPMFLWDDLHNVFYLSDASGSTNVWFTNMKAPIAPATQLTKFPISISNVKFFWGSNLSGTPGTGYMLFTAEIYEACGTDFSCTRDRDAWLQANPNSGIVFDQLPVRRWDQLALPRKTSQLFTQQLIRTGSGYFVTGPITHISASLGPLNVPVPPFGGSEQIDIKLDGSAIAFTGHAVNHESAWNTGWMIYEAIVDPANGQIVKNPYCLTCSQFLGTVRTTNPRYFHEDIAFMAMDRPGFEADRFHMVVGPLGAFRHNSNPAAAHQFNLNDYKRVALSPASWPLSVTEFVWAQPGYLILAADEDGEHRLFSMNLATSEVVRFHVGGTNTNLKRSANKIYFTHASYVSTPNLFYYDWDPKFLPIDVEPKNATGLNPTIPSLFQFPTKFYFKSRDASQVQGWFFKPTNWQPGTSYPFVLLIHGGPQGSWKNSWSTGWNPQLWAERGYAVAMINPHGSTGFGQPFCDAVSGNWGGIPFFDLMDGVDFLLKNNTWIDFKRLAAAGASYGGFMINWIQGNAPTRFSSLVVHAGLYDIPISYGTTDELWFPEWEFKGTPWTNPAGYQKWNPANLADKWQTPMLVTHGARDYRVDLSHGLSAFTTLQRKNIPSKFLLYPQENHWILKNTNNIQWYKEVLEWFDTHTKNRTALNINY